MLYFPEDNMEDTARNNEPQVVFIGSYLTPEETQFSSSASY
jgi:hypothetical protein